MECLVPFPQGWAAFGDSRRGPIPEATGVSYPELRGAAESKSLSIFLLKGATYCVAFTLFTSTLGKSQIFGGEIPFLMIQTF